MVRSSRVVLPDPGELTRLRATTPRPSSHPRFSSANRAFLPRTSCSSRIETPAWDVGPSAGLAEFLHISG